MSRHPDDAALLALASPAKQSDARMRSHVQRCQACQLRQNELLSMVMAMGEPDVGLEGVPSWDRVKPPFERRPERRAPWVRVLALAAGILIFLGWPQAIWGQGPSGPAALEVMAMGRPAGLTPVHATAGLLKVKWSPATGWALLSGQKIPACPAGKVYEAWWIRGGHHIRAGTFRPDAAGRATLWMQSAQDFKGVTAVGITLEPWPGTSSPTGPRQYFGSLLSTP